MMASRQIALSIWLYTFMDSRVPGAEDTNLRASSNPQVGCISATGLVPTVSIF